MQFDQSFSQQPQQSCTSRSALGLAVAKLRPPHLADQLQHRHLQDVTPLRHIVSLRQQVVDCPVLSMVAQHLEGVALGGQVLLALQGK